MMRNTTADKQATKLTRQKAALMSRDPKIPKCKKKQGTKQMKYKEGDKRNNQKKKKNRGSEETWDWHNQQRGNNWLKYKLN